MINEGKIIICLLLVVIIGIVLVGVRQKTCVLKEKFSNNCSGNKLQPGCLRDLNKWVRDNGPKTELNRYCENKDASKQDLSPGQFCVANCATEKGKKGWIPGGKLIKNENNRSFDWEKGDNDIKKNYVPTKKGYCEHV
jgi:hypothetical protein